MQHRLLITRYSLSASFFALFCTFLPLCKPQLLSSQSLPHSLRKTPGVGCPRPFTLPLYLPYLLSTQDLSRPLFVYSSQGGFLHEIAHTRIGTLRCGTLRSLCFAGSYGRTRRSGGSCRPCFARSACNACSPSGACTSGDASSPSISGVLLSPHAACPSCASRVCSHAHYARASGPSCPAGTACFSDL